MADDGFRGRVPSAWAAVAPTIVRIVMVGAIAGVIVRSPAVTLIAVVGLLAALYLWRNVVIPARPPRRFRGRDGDFRPW